MEQVRTVPMPQATVAELFEKRRTDPDEVNFAITGQDGALIGQCGLFRHDSAGRTAELGIAIGDRAIRAYTAAGFSEEGRRLRHVWSDGDYVDVVLMGRFQR
jgi:RimJ/RimL family protein N-acetyltransferase